jgi:hypothetical protein
MVQSNQSHTGHSSACLRLIRFARSNLSKPRYCAERIERWVHAITALQLSCLSRIMWLIVE